MGLFLNAVGIVGVLACFSVAVACFVCGVLKLCEYADERPNFLKKLIVRLAWIVAGMHVGFLVFERLSLWRLLFSFAALAAHYQLILRLPRVQLMFATANAGLLLANHLLWLNYFVKAPHPAHQVLVFYTFMIWAVPMAIMVSLTSTEFLPSFHSSPKGPAAAGQSQRHHYY